MNPNMEWSQLFVQALVEAGLTAVCISPGSRSTPLTLAFAAQEGIQIYRHLDERSAGFFALGLAVATDQPVALVCTSGTAVANYFPAIVEANMSQVPLLVLTGDRPHELRHSGANQTIDQVKIFGEHVLWAVDMPIPQADAPDVVLRHVQTTAVRAYAMANGRHRRGHCGIVPLLPGANHRKGGWRHVEPDVDNVLRRLHHQPGISAVIVGVKRQFDGVGVLGGSQPGVVAGKSIAPIPTLHRLEPVSYTHLTLPTSDLV